MDLERGTEPSFLGKLTHDHNRDYMTQSKLTLEERLINYKISHERYDDEAARLLAAGFTQQQADKIIIRKASKNTVQSALDNHDALLAEPYKLNHEQIVAIAANGGAQAMKTVIASFAQLKALAFGKAQIVAIAANHGGAQAMKTVIASFAQLKALGFNEAQIIAIAANEGSAQAMKTVIASFTQLKALAFGKAQIVAIAANHGGSQAMKTVIASFAQLKALGFDKAQIIDIAANHGGSQAMKTVIASFAQLKALGFDKAQIIAIAANHGGAQAMKTVIASFAQLKALGFDAAQIVAIAANDGGAQAIKAVLKGHSELISHGYSLERITKLAACAGGAKRIQKNNENEFTNFLNESLQPLLSTERQRNQGAINFALEFRPDLADNNGTSSPSQAIEEYDDIDWEEESACIFGDDFDVPIHVKPPLITYSEPLKTYSLFATSSRHKRALNHSQAEVAAELGRKKHGSVI